MNFMSALEEHYTPEKLGKLWGLSDDTIRTMFEGEPGVLVIDRPEKMHKRRYCSIRIPASVAERVHARYQRAPKA